MARRKKIIMVPHGTVDKLCKVFGCRRTAVYDALGFKTDSELAKSIRQNAVTFYGGIQTTKIVL
jgi:hypothetical protein